MVLTVIAAFGLGVGFAVSVIPNLSKREYGLGAVLLALSVGALLYLTFPA